MAPSLAEVPPAERSAAVGQFAADAVRAAAHLSHDARLLKSIAADAVEDGVHAAKRTYKIAVRRFEDVSDQAATRIRRQPFKALGVALGAGLLVGAAGGWLMRTLAARSARRV
jgi:ElaB/YqjD/DUF883 family membrane-anchored ribosome-binding protein